MPPLKPLDSSHDRAFRAIAETSQVIEIKPDEWLKPLMDAHDFWKAQAHETFMLLREVQAYLHDEIFSHGDHSGCTKDDCMLVKVRSQIPVTLIAWGPTDAPLYPGAHSVVIPEDSPLRDREMGRTRP